MFHAVAGRPHERARHVLGVDEPLGVMALIDTRVASATPSMPIPLCSSRHATRACRSGLPAPAPARSEATPLVSTTRNAPDPRPARSGCMSIPVSMTPTRSVRDGHTRRPATPWPQHPARDLSAPSACSASASALHAGLRARLGTALSVHLPDCAGSGVGLAPEQAQVRVPEQAQVRVERRGSRSERARGPDALLGHGGHAGRAGWSVRDPDLAGAPRPCPGRTSRLTLCEERADLRVRGQGRRSAEAGDARPGRWLAPGFRLIA